MEAEQNNAQQNDVQFKPKVNRRVLITNIIMMTVIVAVSAIVLLLALGFRVNENLDLEQTGLVHLISIPNGAMVEVDGKNQVRTDNKIQLSPGEHDFRFSREGYDSWYTRAEVKAGQVLWLNYARLFPEQKEFNLVREYETGVQSMSVSPSFRYGLLTLGIDATGAKMQLVDFHNNAEAKDLMFSSEVLQVLGSSPERATLRVLEWNGDENKVLVQHWTLSEYPNWTFLLLDLKNPENSLDLGRIFNFDFAEVRFASDDGRRLLATEHENLRQIDARERTISAVITTDVGSWANLDGAATIATLPDENGVRAVQIYANGGKGVTELQTISPLTGEEDEELGEEPVAAPQPLVAMGEYYNDNYLAVIVGQKLRLMKGDGFEQVGEERTLSFQPEAVSFSENGQFLMAVSGAQMFSLDLETEKTAYFKLNGVTSTEPLRFLDNFMLYTSKDGKLTVYDFDGGNTREILNVMTDYAVAVSADNKYLYYFGQGTTGKTTLMRMNLTAK